MIVRFRKLDEDLAIELRFVRDDDNWGAVVETKANGQVTSSRFFSDDFKPAYISFHQAVGRAQNSGYQLVVDNVVVEEISPADVVFKSIPALEEAVARDFGDEDSRSVLEDAWLDAGDPRGLLSSVEAASVSDPQEFLNRRRATDKARRLAIGSLYGPLGSDGYRANTRFVRGLVSEIRFELENESAGRPLLEVASHLLSHPMSRFVGSLSSHNSAAQIIDALQHAQPVSLRELTLQSRTTTEISVLQKATPHLERLQVNSYAGTVRVDEPFVLTKLKELTVYGQLSLDSLRNLLASLEPVAGQASIELADALNDKVRTELVSSWLKRLGEAPLSFRYNSQSASRS